MPKDELIECAMRPIHPGEILRDELAEMGLSARALAKALDIPVNRVTQILRERRGVSADTALRLARYFGTGPEFWMDLQSDYELRRARREVGPAIEQSVHPRAA
jgi:addiction module HigA family antidote